MMLLSYVKKSTYNVAVNGAATIVVRALNFILLPFFLSHLTLEDFGIWDFYQMFFLVASSVLMNVSGQSLIRFYILYKDDEAKKRAVVGNSCLLMILGATLLCGSGMSILYCELQEGVPYLGLTIINAGVFCLFSLVISYIRTQQYLLRYFLLFCGQNFLSLGCTLLGIYQGWGIAAFFYGTCISCIPGCLLFIYLFKKHATYDVVLLREQLAYGTPLLISGILYTGFFSVDRIALKYGIGYEALGVYALLWRFGGLYKFFSMALFDVAPIMLFNAHKEENNQFLLQKLVSYICISMASFSLVALAGSWLAIEFFFPEKYQFILIYLVPFFISLTLVELGHVIQSCFGLSQKTGIVPLINGSVVVVQSCLLFCLYPFGLLGILCANSCAFMLYILMQYYSAQWLNLSSILRFGMLTKLGIAFFSLSTCAHVALILHKPYLMLVVLCIWPVILWVTNVVGQEEKQWIQRHIVLRAR